MPQDVLDTLADAAKSVPSDGVVAPDGGGILMIKGNNRVTYETPVHVAGDLVLQGNATLTAPAVYVDGRVSIAGNAKADVGAMYVGGSWTASGNAVVTSTDPAYVAGGVSVSGNAKWKAPLVVTDGAVALSGNSSLAGAGAAPTIVVAGQDFALNGNGSYWGAVCALGDYSGNGTVNGQLIVQGDVRCTGNAKVAYDQAVNDYLNDTLALYAQ